MRDSPPTGQLTVPTEQERAGNFAQSVDLNNKTIVVNDPTTGKAFPGNVIPASRIDPNGQALLKFLPLPNFFDRNLSAGRYNYVFQTENEHAPADGDHQDRLQHQLEQHASWATSRTTRTWRSAP